MMSQTIMNPMMRCSGAPGGKGRGRGKGVDKAAVQKRLDRINANRARRRGKKLDKDEDVRKLRRDEGRKAAQLALKANKGKFTLAAANAELGDELVFGDVRPDDKVLDMLEGSETGDRVKRSATDIISEDDVYWKQWPDNTVPWFFESAGAGVTASSVASALQVLQEKLSNCVQFVQLAALPDPYSDTDYVKIVDGGTGACWSYIGRIGYGQEMSLGEGCNVAVLIQHEFMHVLGFYHEQNRPDRDTYITVNTENIAQGSLPNFEKCTGCRTFTTYNYKSILQYPSYAFSNNGENTMTRKDNSAIPYNFEIQDTDISAIAQLYNCPISG